MGSSGSTAVNLDPRGELVAWIALRRAFDGGLTCLDTSEGRYRYLDRGRPLPDWLLMPLDRMLADGLLALAPPDDYAARRVHLTHPGRLRFEAHDPNRPVPPPPGP